MHEPTLNMRLATFELIPAREQPFHEYLKASNRAKPLPPLQDRYHMGQVRSGGACGRINHLFKKKIVPTSLESFCVCIARKVLQCIFDLCCVSDSSLSLDYPPRICPLETTGLERNRAAQKRAVAYSRAHLFVYCKQDAENMYLSCCFSFLRPYSGSFCIAFRFNSLLFLYF